MKLFYKKHQAELFQMNIDYLKKHLRKVLDWI